MDTWMRSARRIRWKQKGGKEEWKHNHPAATAPQFIIVIHAIQSQNHYSLNYSFPTKFDNFFPIVWYCSYTWTHHVLCAYCLQGVVSLGSLPAEHDAVGSIQHRIGYVTALSAGGSRLLDHALQHLNDLGEWSQSGSCSQSCTYLHLKAEGVSLLLSDLSGTGDWLASSVAATNHHFLGKEDLFCRDLNAQVTPGNHDTIAGLHDLVKSGKQASQSASVIILSQKSGVWHKDGFKKTALHARWHQQNTAITQHDTRKTKIVKQTRLHTPPYTFVVLKLADDLNVFAPLSQHSPDSVHVFRFANEGGKDHVDSLLHAKLQVFDVFVWNSRQVHSSAREVDSLLAAQGATVLDLTHEEIRALEKNTRDISKYYEHKSRFYVASLIQPCLSFTHQSPWLAEIWVHHQYRPCCQLPQLWWCFCSQARESHHCSCPGKHHPR